MSKKQLLYRYERKFCVPGLSIFEVEQIIKTNPVCFSEIFYPRYINNIYLDTFDKRSWHENIEGGTNRVKARIRWYGDLFTKVQSPTLEFKVKQGLLGKKPSYALPDFVFDSSISKSKLHDLIYKSDLPPEIIQYLLKLEPVLINRYQRKYFLSQNKKFRLTLDSHLSYYRIKSWNSGINRAFNDKDNVVVEIKYNKEDDNSVHEITNLFPFRLTKKSKYVSGIYRINY